MKQLTALLIFVFVTTTASQAQSNDDFKSFAKKQRMLMLKDYSKKDIPGYRKHIDGFMARYSKLTDKEKKSYDFDLYEAYYLLASAYAHAGDKKNAVDCLVKSKDDDYDELLHDHDFDNLHKEPGFIKLLHAAKEKKDSHSTLATLQKAPKYGDNVQTGLPAFTYQSADDANLASLKKAFNLDSVAGQGTDVARIINLMEWAHYMVPHDGSKSNPDVKNAMSMITECRQNNKTLNCRGLGILLNEVYLAEGFKSRYVTCLPLDTTDQDCHVITMVWAPSLNKWVWMDPTFMAYVMNENGDLLSIEEVRDRLINNKPLILNPDANHNRNEIQTKNDYLGYYMAKNLYKIECAASSEYNYETPGAGKARTYIQLTPGATVPAPKTGKEQHGIRTSSTYYTNSPKTFWAAPPGTNPGAALARSDNDYNQVMEKFKHYYNNHQTDSMDNVMQHEKEKKSFLNNQDRLEDLFKEYGTIISYKYIGMDDGDDQPNVALFRIVCDKSEHAMGISIDKDNRIGTFRFDTRSPNIDKLLAKEM